MNEDIIREMKVSGLVMDNLLLAIANDFDGHIGGSLGWNLVTLSDDKLMDKINKAQALADELKRYRILRGLARP